MLKFGVYIFATEYAIDPLTLGREAEARGFDFMQFPEHTHIPASRRSPYPGGGDLPKEFSRTPDPYVLMAAVAAVTKTLHVGPGVSLIPERDPILLAKSVASLDQLSGGRILLAIGTGWNREECENHGVPFERRWKVMRERIEAMQAIWRDEEASYHGEFVNFDKIWSWPKPLQKPHPPIILGGNREGAMQRAVRYGDEWMPSMTTGITGMGEKVRRLNGLAAAAGRDPLPVGLFHAPDDPASLEQLIRDGVTRFSFLLPTAGADEVLPYLDQLAATFGRFR